MSSQLNSVQHSGVSGLPTSVVSPASGESSRQVGEAGLPLFLWLCKRLTNHLLVCPNMSVNIV